MSQEEKVKEEQPQAAAAAPSADSAPEKKEEAKAEKPAAPAPEKPEKKEEAKAEKPDAPAPEKPEKKEEAKAEKPDAPAPEKKEEVKAEKPDAPSPEKKGEAGAGEAPGKSEPAKPVSDKLAKIIETVEKLTVLELADLVKALEDRFGVSAAAPPPPAAFPAPGGPAGAPAEEKTDFNVMLVSVGDKKIQVIKEVRAVTNLGLKEAKDLVESAPAAVKENVPKEEAETVKKKLEEAGAKVELK